MAGRLKPLDVERLIKPGKYADGGGLYLIVTGPTSKSWSYRYWKDGKERWHGLGSLKEVSLKDARLARDAARLRVKGDRSTAGVDIVHERQWDKPMKHADERPYANPEAAARKLVELAANVEAVQDGRIHIERINAPSCSS
ncbi:Arm DNA-binding domain-containing protein [Bradyrhizobium japonicum]|uniref:Arm DNA-binding domain-containing protein n=1 Tax=Bradyrhizobium japonicum TaxID=375 RepID=UPI0032219159